MDRNETCAGVARGKKKKRLTFGSASEVLRSGVFEVRSRWMNYFCFGAAFFRAPPVAGLETERRVEASLALNG